MNNISSQSLFHFTPKIEYLFNILGEGFYPRYCLERLPFFSGEKEDKEIVFEFAFPTVCFCDIPFSKTYNHTQNYGRYGIGMKKDWAMDMLMKINPIMYYYPHSYTASSHIFRLNLINDLMLKYPNEDKLKEAYGSTFQYFNFLKPYNGKFWRDDKYSDNDVNFYDEREWRFTAAPGFLNKKNIRQYLKKDEYLNQELRESNNKRLQENCVLYFKSSDIKYIIVNQNSDVPVVIDRLKNLLINDRLDEPIELLYTKVLSLETFEKDI